MQPTLTSLLLKIPRTNEYTPEAAKTFLSTLTSINGISNLQKLFGKKALSLALEIILSNQQIKFIITADTSLVQFLETQLQSNYPLVIIEPIQDPLLGLPKLDMVSLSLRKGSFYPIQTFASFTDIDPLSSILSVFSKSNPDQIAVVQFALESTDGSWQSSGQNYAEMGTKKEDGTYSPRADASIIKEKISFPGFKTSIRIGSNTKDVLREMVSAFGVYTRSDGNSFGTKRYSLFSGKTKDVKALYERQVTDSQVLNIVELATLWHLPNVKIKTSSIVWGIKVLSEPPDNLPAASVLSEEEKLNTNFFARTTFKNHDVVFGSKTPDRMRHFWIVGKSGTGKSTLIANMAIDDIKKGRGVGVIDPHGDLCDTILDYIPANRINDTIYFNPADRDFPIVINPLQVTNREEAELVVSGIVSIFNKIFGFSWGPRLEYILRNTLLTLAAIPDTTLEDVITTLTNQSYRKRIVDMTVDPVLKNFWVNEFAKMPDKQREEAISPILNKVGQFVTSPLIRRIIGQPKSSISLDDIMNDGKIILANLSQGRLGEDNATLLGAMLITKFQLAAMRRVDLLEQDRNNFFLYVDEFQNFATPSFMKILSEARKYKLSLTLANQYMAQIPEEVTKSILGNAGTMITFTCGAEDAEVLYKEFAEVFSQSDLVNLGKHQIAIKLLVEGQSHRPFISYTLPLPASKNQNRDKVVRISRERWGAKEGAIKLAPVEPIKVIPDGEREEPQERKLEYQANTGPAGQREEGRQTFKPSANFKPFNKDHKPVSKPYQPRQHPTPKPFVPSSKPVVDSARTVPHTVKHHPPSPPKEEKTIPMTVFDASKNPSES